MGFKTVLSVIGVDQGDRDIELAANLCAEAGAHISVFVVALAAPPPIGEYAAMVSDPWLQERQADLKRLSQRATEVTSILAATDLSADVAFDYPELASADEVIGRRARYADLTLIGPDLLGGETLKSKALEGTLFFSGKPVLIAPEGAHVTLKPRTVLVAWDSRVEASRAVRESLDLLVAAEDVCLVLVDPEESESGHGAEPGADAAAYLARHGVKVTVERLTSAGHSVAEVLRRRAVDMSAELVVMGAYGHSRLRERIFGGVTRSILADPPLPIFMAR
ncbi:MAG: universal stress protein [Mesorhizobium sp.]